MGQFSPFNMFPNMGQFSQFFRQGLSKPEILPLLAVLGVALGSAGFMGYHQAHSPEVVWNHKTNEQPWQQVEDGDQVKLAAFNQKYDRKFHRKEW